MTEGGGITAADDHRQRRSRSTDLPGAPERRSLGPPRETDGRWQISLQTLLPATLAMLVVLATGPVILIGYTLATQNTERLLAQRAELMVDGLENEMRGLLDPVIAQLGYARTAVIEGRIDPRDLELLRSFALGLLGATPQVASVSVIRPDASMRRWEREGFTEVVVPPERLDVAADAYAAAQSGRSAYWTAPFVSPVLGDTILSYRVALEREGELSGVIAADVRSEDLSRFVADVSQQFGVTAFVLAGHDRIVTYPDRRANAIDASSPELPTIASASDPVIARMWEEPRAFEQIAQLTRTKGHWSWIDDAAYAYFFRELGGYGEAPLIVGVAMPSADTWQARWSSSIAAGAGFLLMIVTAAVAWRIGLFLGRPAGAFDDALHAIARLDFDRVALPHLVDSRVREWRTMALDLQQTAGALAAFQTYLPRALVRRVFESAPRSMASEEREITVMFIDLEGFTAFSRGRCGNEIAAHLNALFASIGPIVEASGGVIDKYTGDGLLAFWGAPDAQPDHATRACRAALEIARVAEAERATTKAPGPRLRIGLHTGTAVVGNIGFPGRIDYTLVGDTVNIAERTETSLRGVHPERPVVIAVTASVLAALDAADAARAAPDPLGSVPFPTYLYADRVLARS